MKCTTVAGEASDTVEFERSGVEGEWLVEAAGFALHAKFGVSLGALRAKIESEIEKNLDSPLTSANRSGRNSPASPPRRRGP